MEIEEAGIRLELPDGVFYNPWMKINRDITEALVVAQGIKSYADIMAASGIRGFRIARHGVETRLNDRSKKAYATMLWNSVRLGMKINITNEDAKEFLIHHKGIEFIDVDPFGTPAPFIPATVEYEPEYLGITATDTANLCGKYQHASRKLYFVELRKTPFCHEVGLRVLLYMLAREAARNDMIIEPILSYAYRHHMRVIVRLIKAGTTAIDQMLMNEIGRLKFDRETYTIEVSEGISGSGIGPIRIGDLGNPEIIRKLIEYTEGTTKKVVEKLVLDSRLPIGYYEIHEISRILGISPGSKREILKRAQEKNVRISETHFSPTGLKTPDRDSLFEIMSEIYSERFGRK